MAKWRNRLPWVEQLKRIPAEVKARVQPAGDQEARRLANVIQSAAPVGAALDPHPGALRDSVHADSPSPLRWRIVIDATDAQGRYIFRHVEFGHLAKGGGHVPPVPFAYPTFRIELPVTRRRLAATGRAGAKAAAPLWFAGR